MANILILCAIILAIALGYRTKINTGFFGIVFAYIIGTFYLGIKPGDIIKMWPISIFFVILAISLFYNFAMTNGTLEKLAQHMLYRTRKVPKLLPFAIFYSCHYFSCIRCRILCSNGLFHTNHYASMQKDRVKSINRRFGR